MNRVPVGLGVIALLVGCAGSASTRSTASTAPAYPPGYSPYPAPAGYAPGYAPPPGYAPAPGYTPPYGAPPGPVAPAPPRYVPPSAPLPPQPAPPAVAAPPSRPLLAPLIGAEAQQAEVRGILAELIAMLPPQVQAKVRGIPLVFDPDPVEINAFAGCDQGRAFMAGTGGLLLAVDGLAQTRATDELFGTRTYDQYMNTVGPLLAKNEKAVPTLPPGIIPLPYLADPRRLSRARELFDDTIAFTFAHELAHHYLGHTGCATGEPSGPGPNPALLGHLVTTVLPGLNQPIEVAADGAGTVNTLDTGRARAARGYRWSEAGGMMLFDFFSRLERAAGVNPLHPVGFLRSHPNPAFRVPIVQGIARTWYAQHPS